jgi:hypothetical protein
MSIGRTDSIPCGRPGSRQRLFALRAALWSASLATGFGCAPTIGDNFRARALDRAAFEMKCPKEQIELVPLDFSLDRSMASGVHVGVKGCETQVVYVFTNQTGWVVDTATSAPAPRK